jgi:integrase
VSVKNVVALQSAPKVDDEEMVIVKDVPAFIELLRGHRLFVPAMISLFTGMRLGEVLALRWGRVDLDRKVIEVPAARPGSRQSTRFARADWETDSPAD